MFGLQGPQLVLISPPRPWYGRPVRPTIKPPRALLTGSLDLEVIPMNDWIDSAFHVTYTIPLKDIFVNITLNTGTLPSYEAESEEDALCLRVSEESQTSTKSSLQRII